MTPSIEGGGLGLEPVMEEQGGIWRRWWIDSEYQDIVARVHKAGSKHCTTLARIFPSLYSFIDRHYIAKLTITILTNLPYL
jgi:hypothetical protein